jgi:hypothetical protein
VLENAAELFPKIANHIDAGLLPNDSSGGAGIGGLLLGLAPVLSLVSSHFTPSGNNLNAMAASISDHPTPEGLATIGNGLRYALMVRDGSMGAGLPGGGYDTTCTEAAQSSQ